MTSTERALSKLREARGLTDWHESMISRFDEWEKQLKEFELSDSVLDLPEIKILAETIARRYRAADNELRTNRNADEKQRGFLFALKDICEIELNLISREDIEKVVTQIERDIDYEAAPYKKRSEV